MRHFTIGALATLLVCALVAPAYADDTAPKAKGMAADTNGDGKLSYDEAKAHSPKFTEERFKTLDANADGFLTRDEMPKKRAAKTTDGTPSPDANANKRSANKPGLFERADADNDGKLTFDEVSSAAPKFTKERFDKVDKNADGAITKEELAAAHPPAQAPGAKLMAADANQDGKVTLEEITAKAPNFPEQRFKKLDANADGFLTKEEVATAAPPSPPSPVAASSTPAPSANEKFKQADADKNGEVTYDEAKIVVPDMTQDQFSRMDRNADGVITPDETPKPGNGPAAGPKGESVMQLAKRADSDMNGKVTYDEMKKVATDMTQERFNQLDTNKDGVLSMEDRQQGGKPGKGDTAPRENAIQKLQAADSNGDGKVTLEEAQTAKPGYPKEAFDKFDTNKDGTITKEDLPAGN
ncbi:MAG: hypothetical protein K1Y02_14590 [Candidatus Hydrogenedentes bacterium]|nr:hypothetical protein [Candidatus Hydrogenedentota bacterium]